MPDAASTALQALAELRAKGRERNTIYDEVLEKVLQQEGEPRIKELSLLQQIERATKVLDLEAPAPISLGLLKRRQHESGVIPPEWQTAERRRLQRRRQFVNAVLTRVNEEREHLGRDLDVEERQEIIDRLLTKGKLKRDNVFSRMLFWQPSRGFRGPDPDVIEGISPYEPGRFVESLLEEAAYEGRRLFEIEAEEMEEFLPEQPERDALKFTLQENGVPVNVRTVAALFAVSHKLPNAARAEAFLIEETRRAKRRREEDERRQNPPRPAPYYDFPPPEIPE